jgi:hypothetical protein
MIPKTNERPRHSPDSEARPFEKGRTMETLEQTPDESFDSVLDRVEADAKAAEFYRWRVATMQPALRRVLDGLRELRPDGLDGDDETAKLARRLEAIVSTKADAEPWMSLQEGAKYAGCTKPDGRPRNSYYAAISKHLGKRQHVQASEIDGLRREGAL